MSAASSHRPPHGGYPGNVRERRVFVGFGVHFTIVESHRDPDGALVIDRIELAHGRGAELERRERERREILERHLTPDAIEIIEAAERELERRALVGEPGPGR